MTPWSLTKSWFQRALSRTGYELVRAGPPNSAPASAGSLASHLRALLQGLRIQTVIDVGAHVGEFGLFLRRIGYHGRIISFEPVEECFERLASLAQRDGNWSAFCLAAGSVAGARLLNVAGESELSSFLEPNQLAAELLRSAVVAVRSTVEVVRLDQFLPALGLPATEQLFLKMDTQGWDMEVLRGAELLLPQIAAFQSEMAFRRLYENAPLFASALGYYERLGYQVSGLFPVSIDYRNFTALEYDSVFVRDGACAQNAMKLVEG
jgi:FkbM family methyltransferase